MLRYLLEAPFSKKESIDRLFKDFGDVFDMFFIPSAPLGGPLLDSLAVSVYAKVSFNIDTIFSIRVRDVNLNHIIETVKTAEEFDIYGVALTGGDPPVYGKICGEVRSEEVLECLRNRMSRVRKGLIISLRFPLQAIYERVMKKPEFIIIINFNPYSEESYTKLKNTVKEASIHGVEAYTYLLLGVGRSKHVFNEIKQPYITEKDIPNIIIKLEETNSNIILSSPRELDKAATIMKTFRRR